MTKILNEFVSNDGRKFKFKIGRSVASSLSGFIAGVVVGSIGWILVLYFCNFF